MVLYSQNMHTRISMERLQMYHTLDNRYHISSYRILQPFSNAINICDSVCANEVSASKARS